MKLTLVKTVLVFNALCSVAALSQMPEAEVRKRLDFIYNGQAERVRIELPGLERQFQNDPGVRYLDAILTTDGAAAVKKFQTIVDQFPENEWADDALYKVYQYYYSVGLYKTADQKFDQLKQQYPNSIYVAGTAGEQKPAVKETKKTVAVEKHPVSRAETADTLPASPSQPPARYAVQAGAFSTEKNAQRQVDFFSTIGKHAVVNTKMSGGKLLYIVSVEGFTNEEDARNFIAELKAKHNIESIIVAR